VTEGGAPGDFADLAELERIATEGWAGPVRTFVQAGAGGGQGIRANRAAHARWSLRARVLVDVSRVDTTTRRARRGQDGRAAGARALGHDGAGRRDRHLRDRRLAHLCGGLAQWL
jgi:FMN-dependent dehydrogenase